MDRETSTGSSTSPLGHPLRPGRSYLFPSMTVLRLRFQPVNSAFETCPVLKMTIGHWGFMITPFIHGYTLGIRPVCKGEGPLIYIEGNILQGRVFCLA